MGRVRRWGTGWCLLACGVAALGGLALPAVAVEKTETAEIITLPPPNHHRLYVVDGNLPDIVDGRTHVVDGDTLAYLGNVPLSFSGLFTRSAKGDQLFVATTYYDRLTRGNRTDVVEIYGADDLTYKSEILLHPTHAQSSPFPGLFNATPDGKLLLIQNATPETSVAVVDLTTGKLGGEIETAGCWSTYLPPGSSNRFATLCGDGKMLTITFDASGKALKQVQSAKLFDPVADPLFIAAADAGKRVLFASFLGTIHPIDIAGEKAVGDKPWSLIPKGEESTAWRPGGFQPLAYNNATGLLYVTMHKNGHDGSHKFGADEIWAVDATSHKLVDRIAGEKAIAIVVTQEQHPLLFALTEDGAIVKFSADGKLQKLAVMDHLATAATELVLQ